MVALHPHDAERAQEGGARPDPGLRLGRRRAARRWSRPAVSAIVRVDRSAGARHAAAVGRLHDAGRRVRPAGRAGAATTWRSASRASRSASSPATSRWTSTLCAALADELGGAPWTFDRAFDHALDLRRALGSVPRRCPASTASTPRVRCIGRRRRLRRPDRAGAGRRRVRAAWPSRPAASARARAVAGAGRHHPGPPRRVGPPGRLVGEGVTSTRASSAPGGCCSTTRSRAGGTARARRADALAIFIDPPAWPAHGRLWAHLVSDTSLDELHAFAAHHGVPRRGFERDHYDVPAELYDALVAGRRDAGVGARGRTSAGRGRAAPAQVGRAGPARARPRAVAAAAGCGRATRWPWWRPPGSCLPNGSTRGSRVLESWGLQVAGGRACARPASRPRLPRRHRRATVRPTSPRRGRDPEVAGDRRCSRAATGRSGWSTCSTGVGWPRPRRRWSSASPT